MYAELGASVRMQSSSGSNNGTLGRTDCDWIGCVIAANRSGKKNNLNPLTRSFNIIVIYEKLCKLNELLPHTHT